MEQRDLIKDQIEQLGRALGQILAEFLKTKSAGRISQGIEVVSQQLQNVLGIDLDALLVRSKDELKTYFLSKKMGAEQLETLSDLLREVGKSKMADHPDEARATLVKSLELLDIADETTATASFVRMDKRTSIENLLFDK